MNRVQEVIKHETLLCPQSQEAGTNDTGTYKSIADAVHDILFMVEAGVLAAGKILTVEVYEADDAVPNNAQEIVACHTAFTAPGGGATSVKVMVSLDVSVMTKPYATVKVTNNADAAVEIAAYALYEAKDRGADLENADELTVV